MTGVNPSLPGIIAPPPRLYMGTFAIAAIGHVVFPLPVTSTGLIIRLFGVFMLIISALLARWSFLTMRKIGTSANPNKESVALSTSGPFAFTRNPIYLAMTGLYIGAGALLNSWWALFLLPPLLYLMHKGVILREERSLRAQFGDADDAYKATVRRGL
jgi:protein-S-isoprenylcysteine O-methyltransferase Ste14